jgi:hypothetical protein
LVVCIACTFAIDAKPRRVQIVKVAGAAGLKIDLEFKRKLSPKRIWARWVGM